MMSPKCSIVENDCKLMLMALHPPFTPQQQYSRVYALFLDFHALVIDEDASFFHFFFHKITNIWCFSSFKIFTQCSHTFCNITMIFKIISKYIPAQPYSFGGRIKLIICQVKHELSVTIHEISTS